MNIMPNLSASPVDAPPILPPPLPPSQTRAGNHSWIIVVLSIGVAAGLLVLGMLAVGTLMHTAPAPRLRGAPAPIPAPAPTPAPAKESVGEPGISYKMDTISSEPWSIHILKV